MKTKYLIATALVVASVFTITAPSSYAFGENMGKWFGAGKSSEQSSRGYEKCPIGVPMMGLGAQSFTEASTEMKALLDQLKTAREAKDTAKVTELRDKIKTQRDTEQKARQTAMDTAISSGYDAWKKYMTDQGAPSKLFEKVTASNFATFAELHSTKKKLMELETKLGVDPQSRAGEGENGKGKGRGHGMMSW